MTKFEKILLQKVRAKGFIYHQEVLDYIDSLTIRERALEFAEKYFEDMRLEKGSIVEKFFLLKYEDGPDEYDVSCELSHTLDAGNYQYVVGILKDAAGETDSKKHTVTIAPESVDDDTVLLHELIHVFDDLYRLNKKYKNLHGNAVEPCVPPFVHDILLLSLYNDLKGKLSISNPGYPDADLDVLILTHANNFTGEEITVKGGRHDVLFFLKSLDLDLRLGYPLGKVCGYGRDKYINGDDESSNKNT